MEVPAAVESLKKNQNKYFTESIMILMRHQLLCSYDIWDLQKEASCHDK